jgi:hypothetical protein
MESTANRLALEKTLRKCYSFYSRILGQHPEDYFWGSGTTWLTSSRSGHFRIRKLHRNSDLYSRSTEHHEKYRTHVLYDTGTVWTRYSTYGTGTVIRYLDTGNYDFLIRTLGLSGRSTYLTPLKTSMQKQNLSIRGSFGMVTILLPLKRVNF